MLRIFDECNDTITICQCGRIVTVSYFRDFCLICQWNRECCRLCGTKNCIAVGEHLRNLRSACGCKKNKRLLPIRFPTQCFPCFQGRKSKSEQYGFRCCIFCGAAFFQKQHDSPICVRCYKQEVFGEITNTIFLLPLCRLILQYII